jgi:hypothetical protein
MLNDIEKAILKYCGLLECELKEMTDEQIKSHVMKYSAGELLDSQSGELTSGARHNKIGDEAAFKGHLYGNSYNGRTFENYFNADKGGCSRILHKCNYEQEELELTYYSSKVSGHERNAGCETLEEKQQNSDTNIRTYNDRCATCGKKFIGSPETICHCEEKITDKSVYTNKNNHPTLKPMSLLYKIFKLFRLPIDDQVVFVPFSGAGSEYISVLANGIPEENIIGVELSEDYIDIAKSRIKYWQENDFYFIMDKKEQQAIKKEVQSKTGLETSFDF